MVERQHLMRQQPMNRVPAFDFQYLFAGAFENPFSQCHCMKVHSTHHASELLEFLITSEPLAELQLLARRRALSGPESISPSLRLFGRIFELLRHLDRFGLQMVR